MADSAPIAATITDREAGPAPSADPTPIPAPTTESELAPATPAPESELAPAPTEPDGPSIDDIPPFDASEVLEATEAFGSGDDLEREPPDVAEVPAALPPPAAPPVGFDFGPTWVDPRTLAATAAAEWRRRLRRDLARAANRGRPSTVMYLKLDIESRPDLSIQEVAHLEGLLLDVSSSLIRADDHVDRTGPARFHMILSEMPEAAALAVAERLRHAFAQSAPGAPRLLIGWATMETEADIALALQRAAERVDDGSAAAWDSPGETQSRDRS